MRIEGLSRCPCPPLSLGWAPLSLRGEREAGPALARPTRAEASVSCACLTPPPGPGSQPGHCALFNPAPPAQLPLTYRPFYLPPRAAWPERGVPFLVMPTSSVAVLTSVYGLTFQIGFSICSLHRDVSFGGRGEPVLFVRFLCVSNTFCDVAPLPCKHSSGQGGKSFTLRD